MKINQSIHVRVAIAIEKGQKRIRCTEDEFDAAARYGIADPHDGRKFIAAFAYYQDVKTGFFAYFNEGFRAAARRAWNITPKETKK